MAAVELIELIELSESDAATGRTGRAGGPPAERLLPHSRVVAIAEDAAGGFHFPDCIEEATSRPISSVEIPRRLRR